MGGGTGGTQIAIDPSGLYPTLRNGFLWTRYEEIEKK
jgi:hypothetical protein